MTAPETYRTLKRAYPKVLIIIKTGDFYEAFGDDARRLAEVCGLPLRPFAKTQIAGFPCAEVETMLRHLLDARVVVGVADPVTELNRK